MIRRVLAVMHARNLEFLRDRATLGWNVLVPIALVGALALIFSGPERPLFKVGVLHAGTTIQASMHPFLGTHYIEFFTPTSEAEAVRKVGRHEIDLLLDLRAAPRYWVNADSPKGYIVEKLLLQSDPGLKRESVTGQAVRYVDWLLPGVLGMNMMFSCLFGVGWVVVRYRKSGFLKRLQATPLRAIEFISAQVLSRLILIMVVMVLVFAALRLVLHFRMEGSYLLLFVVALFGAIALIAIGLFIAARFTSEEVASGIINAFTWPMMLLSGRLVLPGRLGPLVAVAGEDLPTDTDARCGTRHHDRRCRLCADCAAAALSLDHCRAVPDPGSRVLQVASQLRASHRH